MSDVRYALACRINIGNRQAKSISDIGIENEFSGTSQTSNRMADPEKIDIRVGTIISVEEINSDKLMSYGFVWSINNHYRRHNGAHKPKEIRRKACDRESTASKCVKCPGMLFDIGYADGLAPVTAITEKQSRTEHGQDDFGNNGRLLSIV